MSANDPKRTCPSFTLILSEFTLKLLRSPCPGLGGDNEATRFHHIDRQCGSVAVCSPCAAGRTHASHWRAAACSRGKSRVSALGWGVPAGTVAIGLEHGPQRAD